MSGEVIRARKLVTDCIVCIQQPDAACVFALLDRVGPTCIPKAESMGTHVNIVYRSERRCKQYLRDFLAKRITLPLDSEKSRLELDAVVGNSSPALVKILQSTTTPLPVTTEIAVENVPTFPISTEVILMSTMAPTVMTTTATAASPLPATTEVAVENPPTVPISTEFILMSTTPSTAEVTTAAASTLLATTTAKIIPLSGNTNVPMVNIPSCASTEMTNTALPILDHIILDFLKNDTSSILKETMTAKLGRNLCRTKQLLRRIIINEPGLQELYDIIPIIPGARAEHQRIAPAPHPRTLIPPKHITTHNQRGSRKSDHGMSMSNHQKPVQ
ncbi:hypothetical protein Fcan01_16561 [Folsomia candida]|uniref:Uncharacterized protein n=1 Tax=Folsomia candida TaxID=158441 RepID=A0A226DVF6_FOLCA|nr:hypothetical protein Fcan01_16561 [Folsomia candida]